MSDDDADVLRIQRGGGVDNALDHGLAADSVQHFGHFGIHARAFAGGEDDDVEECGGHGFLSAGRAVFKMEKGRLKRRLARALRFQTAFCLFGLDFFPMRAAYFLIIGGAGRQDGMLFGAVLVVAHVAGVSAVFVADGGAVGYFWRQGGLVLGCFYRFPKSSRSIRP